MTTLFLRVPADQSARCAVTITRRLSAVTGVHRVSVDPPSQLVEVRFDQSLTSTERLKRVLAEAGPPTMTAEPDLCTAREWLPCASDMAGYR
jgi:copper chaperone CopZ